MKISHAALEEAKRSTGDAHPMVWYLASDQQMVVERRIMPIAMQAERVATDVQATALGTQEVAFTCTYVQSEPGSRLYWLVVRQSMGSVLYRWKDASRVEKSLIVHCDDEPDTAKARTETAIRSNRLAMIWHVMYLTKRPFDVVERVWESVRQRHDKFKTTLAGIRLADELLGTFTAAQAREECKRLLQLELTDAALLQVLQQTDIEPADGKTAQAILRAALLALPQE